MRAGYRRLPGDVEHGAAHVGDIEQFDISQLRPHFNEIPPAMRERPLARGTVYDSHASRNLNIELFL